MYLLNNTSLIKHNDNGFILIQPIKTNLHNYILIHRARKCRVNKYFGHRSHTHTHML